MAQLPVKSPRIDPRFAPFRLEIRPSKIHRLGVYAAERIPANRKVIEYTGERLNRWQAKQRDSKRFTYLFAVDDYWTLDGAVNGSGAEIINHSCDPNLVSRVMKGHILYMSLRVIRPGEELTVDYNFTKNGATAPPAPAGRGSAGASWRPRESRAGYSGEVPIEDGKSCRENRTTDHIHPKSSEARDHDQADRTLHRGSRPRGRGDRRARRGIMGGLRPTRWPLPLRLRRFGIYGLLPRRPDPRGGRIAPGTDLAGSGHTALNITGSAGAGGATWLTVVDQAPGDVFQDNIYGSEFLCADILIQRFNNTKGAGVVTFFNQVDTEGNVVDKKGWL